MNISHPENTSISISIMSDFFSAEETTLFTHIVNNRENKPCSMLSNNLNEINIDEGTAKKHFSQKKEITLGLINWEIISGSLPLWGDK